MIRNVLQQSEFNHKSDVESKAEYLKNLFKENQQMIMDVLMRSDDLKHDLILRQIDSMTNLRPRTISKHLRIIDDQDLLLNNLTLKRLKFDKFNCENDYQQKLIESAIDFDDMDLLNVGNSYANLYIYIVNRIKILEYVDQP